MPVTRAWQGAAFVAAVLGGAYMLHLATRGPAGAAGPIPYLILFLLFVGLTSYLYSYIHATVLFLLSMVMSQAVLAPYVPIFNLRAGDFSVFTRVASFLIAHTAIIVIIYKLRREIGIRKQTEAALEVACRAAATASEAKGHFLANLSHEIRTPLAGMVGMAEHLLDSSLSPAQRETAQMLLDSSQALLPIVNDIVDYSRFTQAGVTLIPAPFDPGALVSDVVTLMAPAARKKGLQLTFRPPSPNPALVGDAALVRQITTNLVANAVKFTATGGITVSVQIDPRPGTRARVRIEVADTGVGISPQDASFLFEPFVQADATATRKFGGTGLGLAICKRLTDAMGGQIAVDSEIGEGSTFSVILELPIAP